MEAQAEMMEQAGYLPAPVAARKAGVTVYTIYRWIKGQEIEATKVSDRWYVKVASLAEKLGPVCARAAGLLPEEEEEGSVALESA